MTDVTPPRKSSEYFQNLVVRKWEVILLVLNSFQVVKALYIFSFTCLIRLKSNFHCLGKMQHYQGIHLLHSVLNM